ncbi:teichoic acid transport system permease protein [Pilibacter termitis]|jgi:teichoic acid transport system permease protein|uniref:Transport permease protein n=1 Tax=Pilibacter termitis TaxID=263852 RepID=A0A1T4PA45_9ENTE|nr:ABC transporter permease [Pilibacter termitis]SJZ88116.1 teichoic acid transport system permease protein [Pilibacter termitis]
MQEVLLVIKEQMQFAGVASRIAKYSNKALYQSHLLGNLWQVLNPLIQLGVYYFAFGVAMGGNRTVQGGIPYISWLMIGLSTWIFASTITKQASSSVYSQVGMVSRMKFPLSILPLVKIFSELTNYFVFLALSLVVSFVGGVSPSIYWIQFIYYLFAMLVFLYSFSLINSTVAALIRDYQIFLNSIMQVLMYLSGVMWDLSTRNLPPAVSKLLMLNPYAYLITGFRNTFFYHRWFFEDRAQTIIFWLITFFCLIVGSHIHIKFRSKFIDYM